MYNTNHFEKFFLWKLTEVSERGGGSGTDTADAECLSSVSLFMQVSVRI